MLLRIWNLVRKEFIQFFRDWLTAAFILTLPVLQLILLAQATGSRVSDMHVAVLDMDHSSASRQLVTTLNARRELNVCHSPRTLAEMQRLLDQGDAALAAIVPNGFAADLAGDLRTPGVQLVVDASNSIPAAIASSAAQAALTEFAADWAAIRGFQASPLIDLRTTVHFNPTLNTKFFTIPAQVGFIVYQVTLAIASIGLARERELGTLEQLLVIPLRRMELVIGKAIPALMIGALNFLLMVTVARLVFRVPMRGSEWLLFAMTLLFIVAEIGYGILISALARTQQQAILLVFVLAMVDMTFSGYLVPVKDLPLVLRAIAQIVPFSHYLTIIRGVMLKGAGLDALWSHAMAMLLMGLLITVVAVRNLSRSLD